jgi:predicted NUDIX family NTP pyrophosphohydrolase
MPKTSAGLLLFRRRPHGIEVLLAHPGGPLFQNRDEGVWTIPKGEVDAGEDLFATAKREFAEETGFAVDGKFIGLKPIKQKSGKIVHAWAIEGDLDTTAMKSNLFTMEWPPKSGKRAQFPEVDRVEFFDVETAARKIKAAQLPLVKELVARNCGQHELYAEDCPTPAARSAHVPDAP